MNDLGVIIIGIVILALLGFGCRGFFLNANIPLALRIGVGIIGGGVLARVVRAIRARLTKNKVEKPKEGEE